MTHEAALAEPGSQTGRHQLTAGTLVAAALAVCVAQVALAIPAVLNGLFQLDLGPTSSQLTWISDAFLVPVSLLELSFGVIGDLFGRKRVLVGGAAMLALGELVAVLTPGLGSSTDTRVVVLWIGQILAGVGAAALFPTSLAMIAAGTHTARDRARSITIWAAALSTGGALSPLLGGLVTKAHWGSDVDASWRWAFVTVMILGLLSAIVSLAFARNSSAPEGRSLDWPGQITIAVALFALLFGVIQGSTSGWGSLEVVGGFVVAVVFLMLFVLAENRSPAPLLRLTLFRNRAFTVAAIVTVVGMFSFLGTAYATSIRLSAIQGFTPLHTSIAFLLINGVALVQMPITHRALERYNPRWVLGVGGVLIGVGDLWISGVSASDLSLAPLIVPLALIGVGFAFAVSAVTAVAVNTVPNHFAGMASGATSQLRDFGFTLGPAVIGAIALSKAAADLSAKIAASPALQKALDGLYAAAGKDPKALGPVVGAIKSGPLGANAVPNPPNPIKDAAFHALGSAYSLGYVVCGIAALVAAVLALFALHGGSHDTQLTGESLSYADVV